MEGEVKKDMKFLLHETPERRYELLEYACAMTSARGASEVAYKSGIALKDALAELGVYNRRTRQLPSSPKRRSGDRP